MLPSAWSSLAMDSTDLSLKGEPSARVPVIDATLLARHSIKWPMVILEGIAWGLMIISGVIPYLEKGMSSCL